MKENIPKLTVKQLMLSFYAISAFIFCGILIFGFMNQRNNIIEQNNSSFERMITQMTQSVESKCELYNNMLTQMAYSQMIQDYLEAESDEYDRDSVELVTQYLRNSISVDDTIVDVAVFGANGKQVNLTSDIGELKAASTEIPVKTPYYYTGVKLVNTSAVNRNVKECILLGTKVYSMITFDRENPIGTMIVVLDAEKLMSLQEPNELGTVKRFAFDRNDQLFCLGDLDNMEIPLMNLKEQIVNEAERIVLNDTSYSIRTGEVGFLNSRIVLMISENDLLQNVYRILKNQLFLFVLALLAELPLFFTSISWITKPINRLVDFFGNNRENGVTTLKKRVKPEGPKEILILSNNVNGMLEEMDQMTHRLVETTMRLYEAEIAKKQAELEYLYAQINPHFLFNTLESIKGCAITEDAWKCYKMLDALGNVFRYSVSLSDDVPLREELKIVRNYFIIQKMRFGEKLDYEISVPDRILDMRVPKMILQPIAENAVVHGIEEAESGGKILIKGEMSDEYVFLTIRNDGAYMTPDMVRRIEEILYTGYTEEASGKKVAHIGLYNVNNRLIRVFGEKSGIAVSPEPEGGLRVTLRIQKRQGEIDVQDTVS